MIIGFLMFLSFGRLVRSSRTAARRHRAQMRQLAGNFTDAMIGIKPIRAMGRTERFGRLFESDARGIAETLARPGDQQRIRHRDAGAGDRLPAGGCLLLRDASHRRCIRPT